MTKRLGETKHLFPLKLLMPVRRCLWGAFAPTALLAQFDLSRHESILSARLSHLVAPCAGTKLLDGWPRSHGALPIELYGSPERIEVIVSDLLGPSDIKIGFDEARRLASPHIALSGERFSSRVHRLAVTVDRALGGNVISFPMHR